MTNERERFMRLALSEAQKAFDEGETPVGAVLVKDDAVVCAAHNRCEARNDLTAHAELLCLNEGAKKCGMRLCECTLYVTMEPCAMCAGACVNAKLGALVFGAFDEKGGCCGSLIDLTDHMLSHSVYVTGGVLEKECAALLTRFYRALR